MPRTKLAKDKKIVAIAAGAWVAVGVLFAVARWHVWTSPAVHAEDARTGEVRVEVRDGDSDVPIIARVVARLGAGTHSPVVTDLQAASVMKLVPGRYRISATKGVEWSMDAEEIDVSSDRVASVVLRLWHVINPETLVACDLDVHSASMHDSVVTEDERVVSAAASGIRFLLASGEDVRAYGPALSRTNLTSRVFVAGRNPTVAPFELVNGRDSSDATKLEPAVASWFAALNRGERRTVAAWSDSRDAESARAGTPRTYVDLGRWRQGYAGGPLDVEGTLTALRKGNSFITTGPIVDFEIRGVVKSDVGVNRGMGTEFSVGEEWEAKPGDRIQSIRDATVHLRVSAPRWMSVTTVKLVIDGAVLYENALESTPLVVGKSPGDTAIRFDQDIELPVPPNARWAVAMVSGERADDDAVPGVVLRPFATTNPIWFGAPGDQVR